MVNLGNLTSLELIKHAKKGTYDLIVLTDKLEESRRDCNYEKLIDLTEETLQTASSVYMATRGLLLWIYSGIPSIPRRLPQMEAECLSVSFEKLEKFSFSVFKISMPFLLPNKRKRNLERNNAITNAVISTVNEYKLKYKIPSIKHATVFFVSYNKNVNYLIDNDNKDSSTILNGLIGLLLRDDRPTVCNTSYYTRMVDDPDEVKTEVYIVDSDYDIEVLSMIKSM